MKKTLVVSLAVFALVGSTMAFAAPSKLSDSAMDQVAAGSGSFVDGFLNAFSNPFSTDSTSAAAATTTTSATAVGDNSVAANADSSNMAAAGAVASNQGTAINGEHNAVLSTTGNLAVGFAAAGTGNLVADLSGSDNAVIASDNAHVLATNVENNRVDDGSALVVGDNNTTNVSTDNSTIIGVIAAGSAGVVAREATVTDSFNVHTNNVDVDVKIDDSFNVTTNTMDISGENGLSSIVNANTLGDAAIGTNLNVTTATASVPTSQLGSGGGMASVPIVSGNAIALTNQNQVVLNNVAVFGLGQINITK